ncbi:hypothetical protein SDC9_134078 [bioreactor metagenome]|uniref:Uncharacterized protein n=1 Tax=bioreactor metagenome TaxID=1076179 RepID=A0A645DCR4_9ZZZZ
MMVPYAVPFKKTFVGTGGDDGAVRDIHDSEILAALLVRVLKPQPPRTPVGG